MNHRKLDGDTNVFADSRRSGRSGNDAWLDSRCFADNAAGLFRFSTVFHWCIALKHNTAETAHQLNKSATTFGAELLAAGLRLEVVEVPQPSQVVEGETAALFGIVVVARLRRARNDVHSHVIDESARMNRRICITSAFDAADAR